MLRRLAAQCFSLLLEASSILQRAPAESPTLQGRHSNLKHCLNPPREKARDCTDCALPEGRGKLVEASASFSRDVPDLAPRCCQAAPLDFAVSLEEFGQLLQGREQFSREVGPVASHTGGSPVGQVSPVAWGQDWSISNRRLRLRLKANLLFATCSIPFRKREKQQSGARQTCSAWK